MLYCSLGLGLNVTQTQIKRHRGGRQTDYLNLVIVTPAVYHVTPA